MSEPRRAQTAVFYLRSSGPKAHFTRQRDLCRQRAHELGLIVLGEYVDRGEDVEPRERPGLAWLLDDVVTRRIDYVIVSDHDRIARRAYRYASVVWAFGRAGARLEIASLPHQEVDWSAMQLIGRIGTTQLVPSGNISSEVTPEDGLES